MIKKILEILKNDKTIKKINEAVKKVLKIFIIKSNGLFVMFKDKKGKWRFHLKAPNMEIIAVSEGYEKREGCLNGILSIKKHAKKAIILDEENK